MGGGAWSGGTGMGWIIYKGTPRKGVARSKRGLKRGTAKAHQKNTYRQN